MPLNGSEWRQAPWNTTFSPFTDYFQSIFGNGNVFYLIPIIVIAFGIYIKTRDPVFASAFIMTSSGIFAMGTFLAGLPEMGMMFTVFTAIGITILVVSDIFLRKT